jgi:hypothetical protein
MTQITLLFGQKGCGKLEIARKKMGLSHQGYEQYIQKLNKDLKEETEIRELQKKLERENTFYYLYDGGIYE